MQDILLQDGSSIFDRVFIWQGDFRIIIAIIKYLEDRLNVDHDTRIVGVQSVIVIEDNIRYYSSFLPVVYTEMLNQSGQLISEGINLTHRYLRMRARPKILLCSTYEEAWEYFLKYKATLLGIISDIDFPRGGKNCPDAGIEFSKIVKNYYPDIPILLMSNLDENKEKADQIATLFIQKDSPFFLDELKRFINHYFCFGDFIFKMPDGQEVGRATDLKSLLEQLHRIPAESLLYHAERNHFSNWLKARTEFLLAYRLRPRKVSEYANVEELRQSLINSLTNYVFLRQRGLITDFSKETFDPETSFARIGAGSLGGKARGLGFLNTMINDYNVGSRFEGVQIYIPAAVVLATEVFDQFVDENNLRSFALNCSDDAEITRRFLETTKFPEEVLGELAAFLDIVDTPLAVRSSSLLEDSQYHPFAGVYETYMIPNNQRNPLLRLNELLNTIKRVYASTFYQSAKAYIKVTSYRLEEEKMAVIIQKLVGVSRDTRFYPDISGVAKSFNFYPHPPLKQSDGIASIALGLGKTVVDGGNTVRFCPKYPTDVMQFHSIKESLNTSQRNFYALQLDRNSDFSYATHDMLIEQFGLDTAEKDGTLHRIGSTYSPDNDIIYDGISRPGTRLVTFSSILRNNFFPLPGILDLLLDMGTWGMGSPVEIEFAVNMSVDPEKPKQFGLLQMRPLVVSRETEELELGLYDPASILCHSTQVLGNGIIKGIHDIIFVDFHTFDRSKSREVANEVSRLNEKLIEEKRPYLLIGVGRWGTLDPWLGIPVTWEQISGARAIIESGFKDFPVTPSQGSHFFQNITSFQIGYFTVNHYSGLGSIDWDWLWQHHPIESFTYTRLLRFTNELVIKMNGHKNEGIILKPAKDETHAT